MSYVPRPLNVKCQHCGAPRGVLCVTRTGSYASKPHRDRDARSRLLYARKLFKEEQDLERMKEAVPGWCRGTVEVVRVVGSKEKSK